MIIIMINALQSLVPTSQIVVQLAFCPCIERTFDLDYSRGYESDLYCREVSAVPNLYFNKIMLQTWSLASACDKKFTRIIYADLLKCY